MHPQSTPRPRAPAVLADITQGRRLWHHRRAGLGAQLVTYPPAREMGRHSHTTGNITLILAGSFEEEIDGHDYHCGPLCVVFKPAGTVHATRAGETGTRTLVIEVDRDVEDELRRRFGLFGECRWFHELCGLVPCVLGLGRELRHGSEGSLDAWFARLGQAAAAAPRAAPRPCIGGHVRRAVDILRKECSISTATLAQRLGLHPVYLARLFRQELGCSPGRMRQGLRLATALDQIVRSERPLAHAALEAGFADQSHLSRQIKRHAGISAGALRRLGSG